MFSRAITVSSALLAAFAPLAAAVTSLEVQGSDFVNPDTGKRFQIVGIAYQPGGSSGYDPSSGTDPLSDGSVCLRDAVLMQKLGVNAIRVYNVDPDLNHDDCASIFNAAGIYMLLDVNSPLSGESLDRSDPSGSYTTSYVNRTFAVVDAFKEYPNTLAFFSGNEVINDVDTGATVPPYIRAVTRDIKNYIAAQSDRDIPVGYSAADVRPILVDTSNYLQCTTTGDSDDPTRIDLFALNSYSWCGDSSYTTSGYDVIVDDFSNTSVPVFFSEYGCNKPAPRVFTEVDAIFGKNMTPVLSGGLVYEYVEESSEYGLVNINDNGTVTLLADYYTFLDRLNGLDFSTLESADATNSSVEPVDCSASLISESGFSTNFTIPDSPSGVSSIIKNGVSNANVGKIVSVTATSVTQTVYSTSYATIENLVLNVLSDDESNSPSGTNLSDSSSSGTSTSSSASSTATKKGAAGRASLDATVLAGSLFLAMGAFIAGL